MGNDMGEGWGEKWIKVQGGNHRQLDKNIWNGKRMKGAGTGRVREGKE